MNIVLQLRKLFPKFVLMALIIAPLFLFNVQEAGAAISCGCPSSCPDNGIPPIAPSSGYFLLGITDQNFSSGMYSWTCNISNGGITIPHSCYTDANGPSPHQSWMGSCGGGGSTGGGGGSIGQCSTTRYQCASGSTSSNILETPMQYTWQCGTGAPSSNRNCFEDKSGVVPVCGTAVGACDVGISWGLFDKPDNFEWRCMGSSASHDPFDPFADKLCISYKFNGTIGVQTNVPTAAWSIAGASSSLCPGNNCGGVGSVPVFGTHFSPGVYTIVWSDVDGYTAPASQSLTLIAGGTIVFNGNYIAGAPPILSEMTITPDSVITDGLTLHTMTFSQYSNSIVSANNPEFWVWHDICPFGRGDGFNSCDLDQHGGIIGWSNSGNLAGGWDTFSMVPRNIPPYSRQASLGAKDIVSCSGNGGGKAGIGGDYVIWEFGFPTFYRTGADDIHLISCHSTLAERVRTITYTVTFNSSFGRDNMRRATFGGAIHKRNPGGLAANFGNNNFTFKTGKSFWLATPPPSADSLTANPNPVSYGTASSLTWAASGATEGCSINGGIYTDTIWGSPYGTFFVGRNGVTSTGNLTTDTEYTLNCNDGGVESWNWATNPKSVVVAVPPPPTNPTVTCAANGASATISWAPAVGYNTFYLRTRQPDGTTVYYDDNAYAYNSYTLNAIVPGQTYNWWVHSKASNGAYSNSIGGTVNCSVTAIPSVDTLTAVPNPVAYNPNGTPDTSSTLTWSASGGVTACYITGGIYTSTVPAEWYGTYVGGATGSVSTGNLIADTTYTMNCHNGTTWATNPKTVTVTVPPPPTNPTHTCSADGTSATISWTPAIGYNTFYLRTRQPDGITVYYDDNAYALSNYTLNPITPGQPYSWWVHSKAPNGAWSNSIGETFSCPVAGTLKICQDACGGSGSFDRNDISFDMGQNATVQLKACYDLAATCAASAPSADVTNSVTWVGTNQRPLNPPYTASDVVSVSAAGLVTSGAFTGDENITATYSSSPGSAIIKTTNANVSCTPVDCSAYTTERRAYCLNDPRRKFDDHCGGETIPCTGMKSCRYDWTEASP